MSRVTENQPGAQAHGAATFLSSGLAGVGQAVFVACRDSRAAVEAVARKHGVDPSKLLILSRKDNPELRTFEDIVAALPTSTTLLVLDDAEDLLPQGKRDPATVRAFLLELKVRYGRRFSLIATTSDPTAAGLRHEVLRDGR